MEHEGDTIESITDGMHTLQKSADEIKKILNNFIKKLGLANIKRIYGSIDKIPDPIFQEARKKLEGVEKLYEQMQKRLEWLIEWEGTETRNEEFRKENPEKVCKNCGKLKQ